MEKNYSDVKQYFPNLDGLRFLGSLVIIVFHIEDIKTIHGGEPVDIIKRLTPIGNYDVSLFFVLSGFLITYLLLQEKKNSGTINLKAYYARRTLRIWPLYFLILILGFFVLPHLDIYFNHYYSSNVYNHFWIYFIGSCLFLSPFVRGASGLPQTIGPIWSVGVEEVFYLCWPLFLRKRRRYLLLLFGIIIAVVLVRNAFFLSHHYFDWGNSINRIYRAARVLLIEYRISCMAIGGIAAYLVVYEKRKILDFIFRKDFQWFIYILTISLLLLKVGVNPPPREDFPSISHELYSVLFAIIIVNLAANPHSVIGLNYGWMKYLGKISYGLYLYHPIMRILSLELTEHLFKREVSGWQMNACLYVFTLTFTIIIAVLSYEFFEKKFLNLKKRFA